MTSRAQKAALGAEIPKPSRLMEAGQCQSRQASAGIPGGATKSRELHLVHACRFFQFHIQHLSDGLWWEENILVCNEKAPIYILFVPQKETGR